MGRKRGCVIKTSAATTTTTTTTTTPAAANAKKVMPHAELMQRIRKSLYCGSGTTEVSKPLAEYASELFSETHRGHTLNRLSYVEASSIQTATPTALLMALIYLDRLNVTDPGYVRRITPQELFIVSMMISTKFYAGYDEDIYLSDWAVDGNISEDRLKKMELEFLCAIDWNIYISNDQFFDKLTTVEKTLARREGLKRGWLTYTELVQLLPSFTLAKFLLNNITVMAVSYAASVMTIAGAFFLASQISVTSLHRNRVASQLQQSNADIMADAESDSQNEKINATTPATSIIAMRQHNQTTSLGLNVEDELLKLERQYEEENLLEKARQRNNEISTESRLTLPQQLLVKLNVNQKCAKYDAKGEGHQGYWFAHKEQYSDYDAANYHYSPNEMDQLQTPLLMQRYDGADQLFNGLNYRHDNATLVALLWHFLANSVQQTQFMRLPFVWLKFM